MSTTLSRGSGTRLLSVSCGTLCAQFDVDLFKSQSALGKKNIKCVQVAGSDWVTPARNWKRSIIFNKSPIGSFLSLSHDSYDATLVCSQSLVEASPPPTDSASAVDPSVSAPVLDVCSPVLAVIKAARLRFDAASIKKLLQDRFQFNDLSAAMKLLWENCQPKLAGLDFVFHTRRDSEKRTALGAVCDDLLLAFDKLDSVAGIPPIYCEAEHLLHIPVLSPNDAASLLQDTTSLVDKLHNVSVISTDLASHRLQLAELKTLISSSCAHMSESLGNSVSRLSSEVSAIKGVISQASTFNDRPACLVPFPTNVKSPK